MDRVGYFLQRSIPCIAVVWYQVPVRRRGLKTQSLRESTVTQQQPSSGSDYICTRNDLREPETIRKNEGAMGGPAFQDANGSQTVYIVLQ